MTFDLLQLNQHARVARYLMNAIRWHGPKSTEIPQVMAMLVAADESQVKVDHVCAVIHGV